LSTSFLISGCPQPGTQATSQEGKEPRYPAIVYDVPRCYDDPPASQDKCQDFSKDVYLSFDYLANTDSVLWEDIVKGNLDNGKVKYWRLNIWRVSTGDLVGSTFQEDTKTDWLPRSTRKFRRTLPLEVLLRAEFDFCADDTPEKCDIPSEKHKGTSRNIDFLLHVFPEEAKKT
jgi:hypothetical protein